MAYKIKTAKKKIGGSYYALIPSGLIQELDVLDDIEILAEFEKLRDVVKELCNKYNKSGEEVIIKTKDSKELKGIIAFVDKNSITAVSDGNNYIIPFSHIQELIKFEVAEK